MLIPLIRGPTSLSGHRLAGDRLVRFIYVDEAGTSTSEPMAIVAGVILHADRDWLALENHLAELRDKYIPPEHWDGFVFHAKDISAGKGPVFSDATRWANPADRWQVIQDVLAARWKLGFSVSVGYCSIDHLARSKSIGARLRHVSAYTACLFGCESYMREHADPAEVAMIVAEDHPTNKRHIEDIHLAMLSPENDAPIFRELIPVRHIVDTVHFAKKRSSPLLQFADACAFTFRRYFAGHKQAKSLVDALAGPDREFEAQMPGESQMGFMLLKSVRAADDEIIPSAVEQS